jgi:hypothetical protein
MLPRPRGDVREAVPGGPLAWGRASGWRSAPCPSRRAFAAGGLRVIWEEAVDKKVPWISTGLGLFPLKTWAAHPGWRR